VTVAETRVRVRSYELDALGHVNHAVYLNYFEAARFDALEAGGFSPAEMSGRGWGVHVVRVEVDYRRECRLGETLVVRTWVEEFRRSSMAIRHELREEASGALAAEARVIAVWVGSDGNPMRIPPEARRALGGDAHATPREGAREPG
jgi:acyl-CoA thioester hydrolase